MNRYRGVQASVDDVIILVSLGDLALKLGAFVAFTVSAIALWGWLAGGCAACALFVMGPYPPRVRRAPELPGGEKP